LANQPKSTQVAEDQGFETRSSWAQVLALCDLFKAEHSLCSWMLAAGGKSDCARRSVECSEFCQKQELSWIFVILLFLEM